MICVITDAYIPEEISSKKYNYRCLSKFDWRNFKSCSVTFQKQIMEHYKSAGDHEINLFGLSKCGFLCIYIGTEIAKANPNVSVNTNAFSSLVDIDLDDHFFNHQIAKWLKTKIGNRRKNFDQFKDLRKSVPDENLENLQINLYYPDTVITPYEIKQAKLLENNVNCNLFPIKENLFKDAKIKRCPMKYHRACMNVAIKNNEGLQRVLKKHCK
jgi:hypothetical protein